MAQKVLVTTDLSVNSKAGIKFAIQLASQNGSTLVFYNIVEIMKPTRWSEGRYDNYVNQELAKAQTKLLKFVDNVYKQAGAKHGRIQCVVEQGNDVVRSVISYAKKTKANFICMSTRGAGAIKKIWGTNASAILTRSPVPVLVIPRSYRTTKISQIMYSSDFDNLGSELKKVREFAAPLNAKVSVYYYDYLIDLKETQQKLKKLANRFKSPGVKFNFRKLNIEKSLSTHLKTDMRKSKPSLVALFTKQDRSWYERVFLSSKSADLSFDTKTPLLVFRKK